MRLGLVTKINKRNMATSKDFTKTSFQQIVTSSSFFPIYGQFRAIRKPDFGRMDAF